jgi:hypothetical protein
MGVEKRRVVGGGKISFSEGGGGGINIVFGPKYRPLSRGSAPRNLQRFQMRT